jgi:hypothetical protein
MAFAGVTASTHPAATSTALSFDFMIMPLKTYRRSATALDAPERILPCLPMALMLPLEGTETLARRRFVGSYQAPKSRLFSPN